MEALTTLYIIGRFLLGALFLMGGIKHFTAIPAYTEIMRAKNVPYPQEVLLLGSVWQTVFGILFILGIQMTMVSLALVLFMVLATYIWFRFWTMEKGTEREMAFNCFMTNTAIVGGLLISASL